MKRQIWRWMLLAPMVVAGACAPKPAPPPPPTAYFGPTEPEAVVLDAVRRNNAALRSLWARHDFEATVRDEKGNAHFVNGDGVLLYMKPRGMRLVGNKDIAGTIFELGSNEDVFWMKVIPEVDTFWWGHYANVGKPCMGEIPIRPDLVAEVLGVGDIDQDLLREPFPIMRFNNDADAYMFIWAYRGPNRYIAQKEIWYDRRTKLPKLVNLFDVNGRIVVRAYLSRHQQLEISGQPGPWVATRYELLFPEDRTNMTLDLRDMEPTHRGVPTQRSFRFPEQPGVSKVIQIDEACGS